jgi:hypothetical protein
VGMESSSPATATTQVYTGRATFVPMQVDRSASVRANFVQPATGTRSASTVIWDRITVKNANLTGGTKTFIRTAGMATSVDATNLYPFLDGVGVYAGDCAANDPSLYVPTYFNPSATRGWTALNPGDALRAVNVEMPTLRVPVRRTSSTTSFASAKVKLTPLDAGCTVAATGSQTFTASTAIRNFDLAAPFGRYTVCASTRDSAGANPRMITTTVDLRSPVPGTPNRALATMTTGTTVGDCF